MLYYPLSSSKVIEWPGPRDGGSWYHYGTDFAVPVGTPLMASFDGVVVFAGGDGASGWMNGVEANGEGLTVDIQRADGLIARYGHLSSYSVRVGDRVKAGQVICTSGNSGYTTGPHCHWELRWDRAWSAGAWADPRKLGATNWAAPAAAFSSPEEDDMTIFIRRDARSTVWAYSVQGKKARALSSLEWTVIQRAAANAGQKLPLTEEGPAAMKALVGKER